MKINNKNFQTIWYTKDENAVKIINQNKLPHNLEIITLNTVDDVVVAIKEMKVRGAPLIGCAGAFGVYLSCLKSPLKEDINKDCENLIVSRPTAVNLKWAVNRVKNIILNLPESERTTNALKEALSIVDSDVKNCQLIGEHGSKIIQNISEQKQSIVNVLTHCNAGWLATVDWGTATSPIYFSKNKGINLHVWVDETRPRLQGAHLTSFELNNEEVDNTIISDNTGGYLMLNKKVDICIIGADRIMSNGDVINKIGTYEKALAAYANNIPFYVAAPTSTIDFSKTSTEDIAIEERSSAEMNIVSGIQNGEIHNINIYPIHSKSYNIAFDITPSKYITGLICEFGLFDCNKTSFEKIKTFI